MFLPIIDSPKKFANFHSSARDWKSVENGSLWNSGKTVNFFNANWTKELYLSAEAFFEGWNDLVGSLHYVIREKWEKSSKQKSCARNLKFALVSLIMHKTDFDTLHNSLYTYTYIGGLSVCAYGTYNCGDVRFLSRITIIVLSKTTFF